jgi:hypothetical protein
MKTGVSYHWTVAKTDRDGNETQYHHSVTGGWQVIDLSGAPRLRWN